jgi:hypothetical protein
MNMALKPDRVESFTDVSYFMNTTGDRGGVVVFSTGGVGSAMDDADAVVVYPSGTPSGTSPAGVLLNDVVNLDLTRQHINWHKDETQVGGKVTLLRRGQVTTDMLASGQSPVAGDAAYYNGEGKFTTVTTNSTKVGTFLSSKDSEGYVKVDINIT